MECALPNLNAECNIKFYPRFRWVSLQIEALKLCPSAAEILDQLQTLPATLDETYDRILKAIPQCYLNNVVTILRWLAFAQAPLSLEQLGEVVAFRSEPGTEPEFGKAHTWSPNAVKTYCANLITLTNADNNTDSDRDRLHDFDRRQVIKLSHFSVKEYLMTSSSLVPFTLVHSHRILAESCITYLMRFDSLDLPTEDNVHQFPLAQNKRLVGLESSEDI